MDYCDKPGEVWRNPDAKTMFKAIAKGNEDAFQFMWTFWNFTHVYDDLYDRDKTVTLEEAATNLASFVIALTVNPFYNQYKASLLPLIVNACDRWIEGDRLAASADLVEQSMGRVIKCGDLDLFAAIAQLIGGWEHLRAISGRLRKCD